MCLGLKLEYQLKSKKDGIKVTDIVNKEVKKHECYKKGSALALEKSISAPHNLNINNNRHGNNINKFKPDSL